MKGIEKFTPGAINAQIPLDSIIFYFKSMVEKKLYSFKGDTFFVPWISSNFNCSFQKQLSFRS